MAQKRAVIENMGINCGQRRINIEAGESFINFWFLLYDT